MVIYFETEEVVGMLKLKFVYFTILRIMRDYLIEYSRNLDTKHIHRMEEKLKQYEKSSKYIEIMDLNKQLQQFIIQNHK